MPGGPESLVQRLFDHLCSLDWTWNRLKVWEHFYRLIIVEIFFTSICGYLHDFRLDSFLHVRVGNHRVCEDDSSGGAVIFLRRGRIIFFDLYSELNVALIPHSSPPSILFTAFLNLACCGLSWSLYKLLFNNKIRLRGLTLVTMIKFCHFI